MADSCKRIFDLIWFDLFRPSPHADPFQDRMLFSIDNQLRELHDSFQDQILRVFWDFLKFEKTFSKLGWTSQYTNIFIY